MTGVRIRAGEYDVHETAERFRKISDGVVKQWLEHANGRPTICFNVDRRHNNEMADAFNRAGVPAIALDDKCTIEERAKHIKDYINGVYKVLCNIELFTEGLDVDVCSCIILNYASKSFNK